MFERGAGRDEGAELSIVFGCEVVRGGGEGGDGGRRAVWVSWEPCCVFIGILCSVA